MRNYPFFRMYELMLKNKKFIKWDFDKKKIKLTEKCLMGGIKNFFSKKKLKENFFYYNYEDLITNPENISNFIYFR